MRSTCASRILTAFEAAEVETTKRTRKAWLTFVVVGAGPTGVEMAGQIAEIARGTLRREFRAIDTRAARVLLVEAGDRVLAAFPPAPVAAAARALAQLGVTPILETTVVGVDARRSRWRPRTARARRSRHGRSSGRRASQPLRSPVYSPPQPGARPTGQDASWSSLTCRCPGTPRYSRPATWSSSSRRRHAASRGRARRDAAGPARRRNDPAGERRPFRYVDKGNLATIGRSHAVADIKGVQLSGFVAWLTWLVVHLTYLIGFQNRLLVLLRWTFSYVTRGRNARVIHGSSAVAARPPDRLGVGQSSEAPAPGDPRDAELLQLAG